MKEIIISRHLRFKNASQLFLRQIASEAAAKSRLNQPRDNGDSESSQIRTGNNVSLMGSIDRVNILSELIVCFEPLTLHAHLSFIIYTLGQEQIFVQCGKPQTE